MTADSVVVVPNMDRPTLRDGSRKYQAMAPTLAPRRPRLRAWRPGSRRGAEFSRPCSFPYATRDPLFGRRVTASRDFRPNYML